VANKIINLTKPDSVTPDVSSTKRGLVTLYYYRNGWKRYI